VFLLKNTEQSQIVAKRKLYAIVFIDVYFFWHTLSNQRISTGILGDSGCSHASQSKAVLPDTKTME
jgi:hypothetical protein